MSPGITNATRRFVIGHGEVRGEYVRVEFSPRVRIRGLLPAKWSLLRREASLHATRANIVHLHQREQARISFDLRKFSNRILQCSCAVIPFRRTRVAQLFPSQLLALRAKSGFVKRQRVARTRAVSTDQQRHHHDDDDTNDDDDANCFAHPPLDCLPIVTRKAKTG